MRAEEAGSATVTVLVFPVMMLLIIGMIQLGLACFAKVVVTGAAQDAARASQLSMGDPVAGEEAGSRIASYSETLLSDLSIDVETSGDTVTARVSGNVVSLFDVPVRVEGIASGPVERFRPETP